MNSDIFFTIESCFSLHRKDLKATRDSRNGWRSRCNNLSFIYDINRFVLK